jgi:uncharacterized protein
MLPIFMVTAAAGVLFTCLFQKSSFGSFDFWWWMSTNNLVLFLAAVCVDRSFLRRLADNWHRPLAARAALGVLSACLLYGVFYAGNYFSRLLIPEAGTSINAVYALKENSSLWRIVLLISFIIGPGEELLWRGFLQHSFCAFFGKWPGFLLAVTMYAAVHIGSGNFMLVLAAFVCGAFWGLLYLWRGSLLTNVVSHVLWDLLVFVVLPFG